MKWIVACTCVALFPAFARAYMVQHAAPLVEIIKQADVILKGTVLSSEKTVDDSFKPYPSWAVFSTRMRVISVLKGVVTEKEVDFHHYDDDPAPPQGRMFAPQHYHFERGRTYLVFAKEGKGPGVLRPIWDFHRGKEDQGQIRAADEQPVPAQLEVKEAIWSELSKLAASAKAVDVRYAIGQLHSMSKGARAHDGTDDFAREKVLSVLGPLINHREADVASAAIDAVAERSPYRFGDGNMGWLATVGKGTLLPRGHGKYADNWDNPDGRAFAARLIEVADKSANPALRAAAIQALGLCRDKALLESLRQWSQDPAAEVRAAAAVLWSDFPGQEAGRELTRLAADADPSVRRSVAAAVGYMQATELLPLLEGLLRDKDERVRAVAAMSAVSFDPQVSGELLKRYVHDADFRASFVDALALADPKPYLDDLAAIVLNNEEPKLHFVAQMPVYTSWQILKAEMETRRAEELAGGTLDQYLDALDHPPDIGSGPFQEMYTFYLEKGLKERAARFREAAKKRVTGYDIDYFFKRAEESAGR